MVSVKQSVEYMAFPAQFSPHYSNLKTYLLWYNHNVPFKLKSIWRTLFCGNICKAWKYETDKNYETLRHFVHLLSKQINLLSYMKDMMLYKWKPVKVWPEVEMISGSDSAMDGYTTFSCTLCDQCCELVHACQLVSLKSGSIIKFDNA